MGQGQQERVPTSLAGAAAAGGAAPRSRARITGRREGQLCGSLVLGKRRLNVMTSRVRDVPVCGSPRKRRRPDASLAVPTGMNGPHSAPTSSPRNAGEGLDLLLSREWTMVWFSSTDMCGMPP
ncbi:hypothetical protein STENM223S_10992 [Streptomyces tendae]